MQNMWLTNAPLTCFPPYWNSEGRVPKGISYIYSPAACPAGYTSAQQVITGSGSGANTAAVCCYSSFSYYTVSSKQSGANFASSSFVGCLSIFSGTTTVQARSNDNDLNTTSISGPVTMWAQPLVVQHHSSDLSLFAATTTTSSSISPTSDATSASGSSTASVVTPTSTSPASATTQAGAKGGGLSTGVKAGIAIGAIGGFILLCILIAFPLWRRRRQQRQNVRNPSYVDDNARYEPNMHQQANKNLAPVYGVVINDPTYGRGELYDTQRHAPVEMGMNESGKAELVGSSVDELGRSRGR